MLSLLAVPYVPYWSYGERLPALRDESSNRLSVGFAHETLAALLADDSASIRGLMSRREATVSRVKLAGVEFQYDVFVSYSSTDRELMTLLVQGLTERGLRVFSDMAVRPGDRWLDVLAEARASSRVAVIVVGRRIGPMQAPEIVELQEINGRDPQRRRIIPVIRKGVGFRQMPDGLEQYFGLREEDFESLDELAEALAAAIKDPR